MNFIAGYLLIITKDEEKSFWLMDALIGRILPGVCWKLVGLCTVIVGFILIPLLREQAVTSVGFCVVTDYYTPAMLGLKTDQEVLGELVRLKLPGVWQTMMDHNVMWTLVVSRWFICLYIDILPVEVSMFCDLGSNMRCLAQNLHPPS